MTDPNALTQEIRRGLFFVVGHHRGGTTLLQSMLNAHSALTVPPETQYFLEVWPRRRQLGDLRNPEARDRVFDFLESRDCSVRDLKLSREAVAAALAPDADYAELFATLLEVWARERGKRRAGEKSPGHIHQVLEIAQVFPEARFLAMLRDPRAVVASELTAAWGARSVDQIARRWRRVAERHRELTRRLPSDRYLGLRYEELVSQPEATLRGVCDFLGEPFEDSMLRYDERAEAERGFDPSESWKLKTLKPLDPDRREAWRDSLDAVQIALVENAAGEGLEALGYRREAPERSRLVLALQLLRDRVPWAIEVATGAARRKRGPQRARRGEGAAGGSP